MNYAAIFVNCLVILYVNYKELNKLLGSSPHMHGIEMLIILVAAEHIIILIKFLLQIIIDDTPHWVELGLKKYDYLKTVHE